MFFVINLFTCCVRLGAKSNAKMDSRGAFHSTKTFENQETVVNGTEISRNVARNSGNCRIYPKCEPFKRKFW